MACGSCGGVDQSSRAALRLTVLGTVRVEAIERAAMCRGCGWRRDERCGASGLPIGRHVVHGLACHAGRHGRRPRALGVVWVRVPWVTRRWLALRGLHQARHLPGCGCIAGLRLTWRRWQRAQRDRAFLGLSG